MPRAYRSGRLPLLERALDDLKCLRPVLQWVPSHCGIAGNEKADGLAKAGSSGKQTENPVSVEETRSIIKSIFRPKPTKESFHYLQNRKEQVGIFRLRTGHNRLNSHMNKKMKKVSSPLCPC